MDEFTSTSIDNLKSIYKWLYIGLGKAGSGLLWGIDKFKKPILIGITAYGIYQYAPKVLEALKNINMPRLELPKLIIPEGGDLCIPDGEHIFGEAQEKTVEAENKLVNGWFGDGDSLWLLTDRGILSLSKAEFMEPLSEYNAEPIAGAVANSNSIGIDLLSGGWDKYLEYICSSDSVLNKVVNHFCLNQGSEDERIKNILLFLQSKNQYMQYRYDSDPSLEGRGKDEGCREYLRKPAISIIHGLQSNGYIGDCDDYASDFIALCRAAEIPENKLCLIIGPQHAFAGIISDSVVPDYTYYYIGPNGEKIIPIEATNNATMKITPEGLFKDADTTYQRTPTIGGNINIPIDGIKVSIRSKDYPHGFNAKI